MTDPLPMFTETELATLRQQLDLLHQRDSAKEVASKSIGRYGLAYITVMVLIGVGSSSFLSEAAITAVMTMLGAALMALIQMLHGITGVAEKPERPEFTVIESLIEKLNELASKPLTVSIDGERVTVQRGNEQITTRTTKGEPA